MAGGGQDVALWPQTNEDDDDAPSCLRPETTTTPTSGSTPLTLSGKPPPWVAY